MRTFAPLLLVLACTHPQAATFLVDTTNDNGSPAFQVCDGDASNANCSLRGALAQANVTAAPNTIVFDLATGDAGYVSESAHWRFSPASEYPYVTRDLTIDGYSQSGAAVNTNTPDQGGSNAVLKIEIKGPGVGTQSSALRVTNGSGALTLRGVAASRFQVNLALDSPGAHRIEGCFIGTDISGSAAGDSSNGSGTGIRSGGPAIIGGATAAARNVISGNPYIGISNSNGVALTVQGNLIGTNAAGSAALPGQDYGVYLSSVGTGGVIGGATSALRNLISGNAISAVYVFGQISGTAPQPLRVLGNFIGTDVTGMAPIGNGLNPQSPSQPQPTLVAFGGGRCGIAVGGDAAGEGNLIASGGAAGVLVSSCTGARVVGNRFVGNRGIGIDLSVSSNADGRTPNDPGDGDGNPPFEAGNRLQNHPELISLACTASTCALTYRVDTALSNATYPLRIDVARGRAGQAAIPVVVDSYAAIDAGLPKSVTFPVEALQGGGALVLSATDAAGNTSEFGGDLVFEDDFD